MIANSLILVQVQNVYIICAKLSLYSATFFAAILHRLQKPVAHNGSTQKITRSRANP